MIILLEGPNGAGKTSIARELARLSGGVVEARNYEPVVPLAAYTAPVESYVQAEGKVPLICDRWHLSERVYGPMLRGRNKITPVEWCAIEGLLIRMRAVGFICDAPVPVLLDRLHQKGETVDEAQLVQERLAFAQAETWSMVPWYQVHTGSHTPERLAEAILAHTQGVRPA